jgi:hypothetical protein
MPKENITCSTSDDFRAEVRWRPDPGDGSGDVQIATVNTAKSQVTIVAAVPAGITSSSAMSSAGPGTENGWFVDLNREQINRLIRVLRRARDAAYGADA